MKIYLNYNKELDRQELMLLDERPNKASYSFVYINPKIDTDTNLKALVKWLNDCFEQINEQS